MTTPAAFMRISASHTIAAPPAAVYGVLSDYEVGHPAILPKRYFKSLTVETGGKGAGTIIRVQMTRMGGNRTLRLHVTEPEAGQVLQETDPDNAITTFFKVEGVNGGEHSRVTIETDMPLSKGLGGLMLRLMKRGMQSVYMQELRNLEAYVLAHP